MPAILTSIGYLPEYSGHSPGITVGAKEITSSDIEKKSGIEFITCPRVNNIFVIIFTHNCPRDTIECYNKIRLVNNSNPVKTIPGKEKKEIKKSDEF
jgi:hypothetical protein